MKTLETARLNLRKFEETDFKAVHSYASCTENLTYMRFGPNSEAQTRLFIRQAIAYASEKPINNYQFAVTLKDTGALIGSCDIYFEEDEAEAGWLLHRDYWKMGYGSEIANALLKFGFEDLNCRRITAHCDAENTGSRRLMEKAGMRREGLFFDARPAHKLSDRPYGDELAYAMLKDEWEIQKEIACYNALPCVFDDFIDVPALSSGEIFLVCTEKIPGDPEKKWVPAYRFAICKGGGKVGEVNLRIGYNDSLYYSGQIGYAVDEGHRGKGYAAQACRLVLPVAKAHGMTKLLITNNVANDASRRVCEKLGARLLREVRLPEWTDLYKGGQRFENIFELELE
jgi:RimJ/RimL family protein N-acetyltransferase